MAVSDDHDLGYTEICSRLSARFGTRFELERIGECVTMTARCEVGVSVVITDCGETLSPVEAHLAGRAAGFYVGIHTTATDLDDINDDSLDQIGYACDPTALPTEAAIGDLVDQALAYTRFVQEANHTLKQDVTVRSLAVPNWARRDTGTASPG